MKDFLLFYGEIDCRISINENCQDRLINSLNSRLVDEMTPTDHEIKALVADEIDRIPDPARRAALVASLVAPELQDFRWEYSDQRFDCWVVARAPDKRLQIVYSTPPPIRSYPWCTVSTDDHVLGMDCFWFLSLDDAFINGWWDGPISDGYEIS